MTNFAFFNYTPEGRIIQTGSAPNPLDQVWDDIQVLVGEADGELHWVENGQRVDRPSVTTPTGASYDLGQLPPDTTVLLRNEVGDTELFAQTDGVLTLTDPGIYHFEILPPFPYRPLKTSVEIS